MLSFDEDGLDETTQFGPQHSTPVKERPRNCGNPGTVLNPKSNLTVSQGKPQEKKEFRDSFTSPNNPGHGSEHSSLPSSRKQCAQHIAQHFIPEDGVDISRIPGSEANGAAESNGCDKSSVHRSSRPSVSQYRHGEGFTKAEAKPNSQSRDRDACKLCAMSSEGCHECQPQFVPQCRCLRAPSSCCHPSKTSSPSRRSDMCCSESTSRHISHALSHRASEASLSALTTSECCTPKREKSSLRYEPFKDLGSSRPGCRSPSSSALRTCSGQKFRSHSLPRTGYSGVNMCNHSTELEGPTLSVADIAKAPTVFLDNDIISKQREEIQLLMEELAGRDSELTDLVSSHQRQVRAWEADRDKLDSLNTRLAKYEDELNKKQQQLSDTLAEMGRVQEQKDIDLVQLGKTQADMVKLAERISENSRYITEIEYQNKSLSSSVKELLVDKKQLEEREREITLQLEEKNAECVRQQEAIKKLSKAVEYLENEVEATEDKCRRKVQENEAWRTKFFLEKDEAEKLAADCDSKDLTMAKMTQQLQESLQQAVALQKALFTSCEREKCKEEVLHSLRKQHKRTMQELANIRELYDLQARDLATFNPSVTRDKSTRSVLSGKDDFLEEAGRRGVGRRRKENPADREASNSVSNDLSESRTEAQFEGDDLNTCQSRLTNVLNSPRSDLQDFQATGQPQQHVLPALFTAGSQTCHLQASDMFPQRNEAALSSSAVNAAPLSSEGMEHQTKTNCNKGDHRTAVTQPHVLPHAQSQQQGTFLHAQPQLGSHPQSLLKSQPQLCSCSQAEPCSRADPAAISQHQQPQSPQQPCPHSQLKYKSRLQACSLSQARLQPQLQPASDQSHYSTASAASNHSRPATSNHDSLSKARSGEQDKAGHAKSDSPKRTCDYKKFESGAKLPQEEEFHYKENSRVSRGSSPHKPVGREERRCRVSEGSSPGKKGLRQAKNMTPASSPRKGRKRADCQPEAHKDSRQSGHSMEANACSSNRSMALRGEELKGRSPREAQAYVQDGGPAHQVDCQAVMAKESLGSIISRQADSSVSPARCLAGRKLGIGNAGIPAPCKSPRKAKRQKVREDNGQLVVGAKDNCGNADSPERKAARRQESYVIADDGARAEILHKFSEEHNARKKLANFSCKEDVSDEAYARRKLVDKACVEEKPVDRLSCKSSHRSEVKEEAQILTNTERRNSTKGDGRPIFNMYQSASEISNPPSPRSFDDELTPADSDGMCRELKRDLKKMGRARSPGARSSNKRLAKGKKDIITEGSSTKDDEGDRTPQPFAEDTLEFSVEHGQSKSSRDDPVCVDSSTECRKPSGSKGHKGKAFQVGSESRTSSLHKESLLEKSPSRVKKHWETFETSAEEGSVKKATRGRDGADESSYHERSERSQKKKSHSAVTRDKGSEPSDDRLNSELTIRSKQTISAERRSDKHESDKALGLPKSRKECSESKICSSEAKSLSSRHRWREDEQIQDSKYEAEDSRARPQFDGCDQHPCISPQSLEASSKSHVGNSAHNHHPPDSPTELEANKEFQHKTEPYKETQYKGEPCKESQCKIEQQKEIQYRSDPHTETQYSKDLFREAQYRSDASRENQYRLDTGRENQHRSDISRENQYKLDTCREKQHRSNTSRENQYKLDTSRENEHRSDTSRENQHGSDTSRENQHRSEISRENQYKSDTSRENQHRSDTSRENQYRSDTIRENQHGSDTSRENQHRSDTSRENQYRSDTSRENQHKSDTNREGHYRPETAVEAQFGSPDPRVGDSPCYASRHFHSTGLASKHSVGLGLGVGISGLARTSGLIVSPTRSLGGSYSSAGDACRHMTTTTTAVGSGIPSSAMGTGYTTSSSRRYMPSGVGTYLSRRLSSWYHHGSSSLNYALNNNNENDSQGHSRCVDGEDGVDDGDYMEASEYSDGRYSSRRHLDTNNNGGGRNETTEKDNSENNNTNNSIETEKEEDDNDNDFGRNVTSENDNTIISDGSKSKEDGNNNNIHPININDIFLDELVGCTSSGDIQPDIPVSNLSSDTPQSLNNNPVEQTGIEVPHAQVQSSHPLGNSLGSHPTPISSVPEAYPAPSKPFSMRAQPSLYRQLAQIHFSEKTRRYEWVVVPPHLAQSQRKSEPAGTSSAKTREDENTPDYTGPGLNSEGERILVSTGKSASSLEGSDNRSLLDSGLTTSSALTGYDACSVNRPYTGKERGGGFEAVTESGTTAAIHSDSGVCSLSPSEVTHVFSYTRQKSSDSHWPAIDQGWMMGSGPGCKSNTLTSATSTFAPGVSCTAATTLTTMPMIIPQSIAISTTSTNCNDSSILSTSLSMDAVDSFMGVLPLQQKTKMVRPAHKGVWNNSPSREKPSHLTKHSSSLDAVVKKLDFDDSTMEISVSGRAEPDKGCEDKEGNTVRKLELGDTTLRSECVEGHVTLRSNIHHGSSMEDQPSKEEQISIKPVICSTSIIQNVRVEEKVNCNVGRHGIPLVEQEHVITSGELDSVRHDNNLDNNTETSGFSEQVSLSQYFQDVSTLSIEPDLETSVSRNGGRLDLRYIIIPHKEPARQQKSLAATESCSHCTTSATSNESDNRRPAQQLNHYTNKLEGNTGGNECGQVGCSGDFRGKPRPSNSKGNSSEACVVCNPITPVPEHPNSSGNDTKTCVVCNPVSTVPCFPNNSKRCTSRDPHIHEEPEPLTPVLPPDAKSKGQTVPGAVDDVNHVGLSPSSPDAVRTREVWSYEDSVEEAAEQFEEKLSLFLEEPELADAAHKVLEQGSPPPMSPATKLHRLLLESQHLIWALEQSSAVPEALRSNLTHF